MKILFAILTCALMTVASADDDPWMYPVAIGPHATNAAFASLTMINQYVGGDGFRRFESTTRVVSADAASFQEIVKWYADKVGETRLPKILDRFVTEGKTEAWMLSYEPQQLVHSTHIRYRFLPDQKQITLLHAEENGDVVAISLLGLDRETSIQVLRHLNPKNIAQNGGEPSRAPETAN